MKKTCENVNRNACIGVGLGFCVIHAHSWANHLIYGKTKNNHSFGTSPMRFVSFIDNLDNIPSLIFRSSVLSVLVMRQAKNRRKRIPLPGETN